MICLNIINYNEEESGIGGLTAAIYAAKAGFPALLSRENLPLSAF